ncbi:MAG: hypothetical protein IID43_06235 [Planctomycetes bacterium]|nr:hypothetical protein [Planctomycetota bacterium]
MSLGDVKYQPSAQRLLQRALLRRRVPHAYLFHGPDGVGKETLALGLAGVLLCAEPKDVTLGGAERDEIGLEGLRTSCGTCDDCLALGADTHPDLHLVYRQLNRDHPEADVRKRKALALGVDVIRHFLIARAGLTPARGRAKVFIVRDADRMTTQAQNALLKTLEEPPPATFIMLLVCAADRMLATTLSRCQTIAFDALPTSFVRRRLETLAPGLSDAQLDFCAEASNGSLGRAVQYAQEDLFAVNAHVVDNLIQLDGHHASQMANAWADQAKSLAERYRKQDPDITETEAKRRGLKSLLQLSATWYADLLRFASGDGPAPVNSDRRADLKRVLGTLNAESAAMAVLRITQTERELDLNANSQLCVESLLNDLARINAGKSLSLQP